MALVRCLDCQKEVSDQAPACIHCGRPSPRPQPPVFVPARKTPRLHTVCTVLGGVLLFFGMALLVLGVPKFAGPATLAGLGLALVGSLWRWVASE